jgi:hypothetical protein
MLLPLVADDCGEDRGEERDAAVLGLSLDRDPARASGLP